MDILSYLLGKKSGSSGDSSASELYDGALNLTDAQKEQARENIGAAAEGSEVSPECLPNYLQYGANEKTNLDVYSFTTANYEGPDSGSDWISPYKAIKYGGDLTFMPDDGKGYIVEINSHTYRTTAINGYLHDFSAGCFRLVDDDSGKIIMYAGDDEGVFIQIGDVEFQSQEYMAGKTFEVSISSTNGCEIAPKYLPENTPYRYIKEVENAYDWDTNTYKTKLYAIVENDISGNVAMGGFSHAEGCVTSAMGDCSHVEGYCNIASHRAQHVFGEYNEADSSANQPYERGTYVEIVGNGTGFYDHSNARTLDWSGNEVLAGKLTVGAGPTNPMDVATKQYVDNKPVEDVYFSSIKAISSNAIRSGYLINGMSGGYRELQQGKSFVITYPMLFSKATVSGGQVGEDCAISSGLINLKLTNNNVDCGFTAYKAVYVKGSLNGVTFTVASDNAFTQDVPQTADGLYYYLLGYATSINEIELLPHHEVFKRDESGWFGPVGANNLTAGEGISISNGQISLNLENAEEGEF